MVRPLLGTDDYWARFLALTTIAPVFQGIYGFPEGETGLAYLGIFIGMMLACVFSNLMVARKTKKTGKEGAADSHNNTRSAKTPENVLIPSAIASVIVAAGFVLFGWSVQRRVQWMAPIAGTGLVGFGYFLVTLGARAYIIETFGIWSVSAIAAMLSVRNLAAAVLPLVGPALWRRLGYGWGGTLLAFLGLGLTPVPILLIRCGERLRRASKIQVLD